MPELECCQLPGIVHRSLKHEVMVVDEWHDKGPQDLVTVSLCIQNSNNYMQLCSLSMTNASPYHSSPVAIGHFHNHQQSAHPHNAILAICHLPCADNTEIPPCWKHLSKVLSNENVFPLKLVTVWTQMRKTSLKMSFPEVVSDSVCKSSLVLQTQCCSSWSQTMLEVKMLMCWTFSLQATVLVDISAVSMTVAVTTCYAAVFFSV